MTTIELDHLFYLRWRLGRTDWAAFEALRRTQGAPGFLGLFLPLFLIGMFIGAFFELGRDQLVAHGVSSDWFGAVVVGATLCILALWYVANSMVFTLLQRLRTAKRILPDTDTILTADHLHCFVTQDGKKRQFDWEELHVISTPNHVFLFPEPNDAIIIPLRAFETEAHLFIFAHVADQLGSQAIDRIESGSGNARF